MDIGGDRIMLNVVPLDLAEAPPERGVQPLVAEPEPEVESEPVLREVPVPAR